MAAGAAAQTPPPDTGIEWRESRAVGKWWAGSLRDGVQLPADGVDFFTWDPALRRAPNREWRRWGTDTTVRTVLDVITEYRAETPWAPRVAVGDLSRPRGGPFGKRYGGLGHASHQNGLDVDIFYPRLDGLEREPRRPSQVDQVLAQDLVDRFLEAGAIKIFVGPRLSLTGPRKRVVKLVHHDDHMHVRFPKPRR